MLRQFCRACGNEVFSGGGLPLEFCTNCGERLLGQTHNYQPVSPTVPVRAGRGGSDKTVFWVLISVPVIFILLGIGGVGLLFYAASQSRSNYTRYPPPPKTPPSEPQKTSNSLLSFGKDGLGQGEFKNAESIAVDKEGNIYVGDGTLRVQKFDAAGKFLQLWNVTEGKIKADEKYTTGIDSLAIDSKNRLYVAVGKKDLLRYDGTSGKFIDRIELNGERWMNTKQEATILDMVMLNDDRLAVFATSFPDGEYVMMVSPDGKPEIRHKDLFKNQSSGKRPPINGSMLVTVTGEIFLMDGLFAGERSYIYRFRPDGGFVDRFTWEGAPTLPNWSNKIIALSSKGEIFAYNAAKSQINVLSVEGISRRTIPLKANTFRKMILDADDNIYVVGSAAIEKFSPAGL